MAKRKRQLRLLEENPPETRPLFNSTEFPCDTPDEIAYNAKRKKEGLFVLTDEEVKDNEANTRRGASKTLRHLGARDSRSPA